MTVQFLKTVFFVTASILWAVVSSHCQLEVIPAFQFLACVEEAEHHEEAESAPHCNDDACKNVEEGAYFFKQAQPTAAKVVAILPYILFAPIEDHSKVLPEKTLIDNSPQAPPSWHFVNRTALPVRAPSLVS